MRKLQVPKRVVLPNCRTFVARYDRINRRNLPPNIRMRRTYRQRAALQNRRFNRRRAVRVRGIGDNIKKVLNNPIVKEIAKKGLEYAPGIYHNITKRVKNKTASRILNSDLAHLALSRGIKVGQRLLDVKPKPAPRKRLLDAKPPIGLS